MQPMHLLSMDFYLKMDVQSQPVLVLFVGPKCGACRRLLRLFDAGENFSFPCYQLNAEDSTFLLEEYAIQHLPSLMCFQLGELLFEVHDVSSLTAIEEEMKQKLNQGLAY
jgi:thioredoxin-like negative regulator of GroEL